MSAPLQPTSRPTETVLPAQPGAVPLPDQLSCVLRGCLDTAPRIAVYRDAQSPPLVVPLAVLSSGEGDMRESPDDPAGGRVIGDQVADVIAIVSTRAFGMARDLGGAVPLGVFRELVENLVHAAFSGVVITLLDGGNTVRISDRGPGIPDKQAALRPGFTSADADAKRYIRGVGSGFSVVKEMLAGLGGTFEIEDNLGTGTVVTARIPPRAETPLAPASAPAYNLSERQLKVLLLTVELAPVGPTRIALELGVSTSTAYRDLVTLEEAGFVVCRPSGHRSATDAGLAYLNVVL